MKVSSYCHCLTKFWMTFFVEVCPQQLWPTKSAILDDLSWVRIVRTILPRQTDLLGGFVWLVYLDLGKWCDRNRLFVLILGKSMLYTLNLSKLPHDSMISLFSSNISSAPLGTRGHVKLSAHMHHRSSFPSPDKAPACIILNWTQRGPVAKSYRTAGSCVSFA